MADTTVIRLAEGKRKRQKRAVDMATTVLPFKCGQAFQLRSVDGEATNLTASIKCVGAPITIDKTALSDH
jgi:hypothetical protein